MDVVPRFRFCYKPRLCEEVSTRMSKPMVLVFVLLMLIITSQFEWKQHSVNESDVSKDVSQETLRVVKKEQVAKEKIILIQEKKIHHFNELPWSLQQQLIYCQRSNHLSETSTTILDSSGVESEIVWHIDVSMYSVCKHWIEFTQISMLT